VKKKMISIWKKQEKVGEGDWARKLYWQDAESSSASAPPTTPLLPVRATRLRIGLRLGHKATRRLSLTREGEGAASNDVGPTCQRQQPNCGAFSLSIYCVITTWPRRHLQPSTLELVALLLQLQSSSPNSYLFNFSPPCQLHPLSPPTSTLVAIKFQTPSLCYFLPSA
jgi:hypothetical protein